jgi:predicted metalloprotease
MDWQNTPESTNVEDRRGAGGGVSLGGGGAGGLGIGAILIIGLISYFTGIDPRILIGGAQIVTDSQSIPTILSLC